MADQSSGITPASRLQMLAAAGLGLVALFLVAARLRFAVTEPLWFDETFTLALALRPDWASFWREVYLDSNGPAYYLIMRLWTLVFGASDLALRVPTLLAVCAAGALPLVVRLKGISTSARVTWGALIFAWWGVGFFLDARCYAMLLMVSTAQCLAFGRLMEEPTLRRTFGWAGLAALAILLHYYAVFLGLAQGLVYLARHRERALKTWPAGLAFVPAFGWIAYHAPRLGEYSKLSKVWHPTLGAQGVWDLIGFAFGPTLPAIVLVLTCLLGIGYLLGRQDRARGLPTSRAAVLTAVAGVLAFGLMLAFGLLGPGLSARYLISICPPLMLGVVLLAGASGQAQFSYLALIAIYFGFQIGPALEALGPAKPLPRYEFETGSRFLAAHGVSDVVFVWDHELAPIIKSSTLEAVGGVFFARAGHPVVVRPLALDARRDPNLGIVAVARAPRPGMIWLFNRQGHTVASRYAPAIAELPGWHCTEQGNGMMGSLACYRAP